MDPRDSYRRTAAAAAAPEPIQEQKPVATFGNEFDYIRNSLLAEKVPSSSAVMVVVVVVVEDRQKQRWSNPMNSGEACRSDY